MRMYKYNGWITATVKPATNEYVLVKTQNEEVSLAKWTGVVWVLKVMSPTGLTTLRNVVKWHYIPE